MAGYIGTKAVNLSTTAATVGGDADIGGALDVGGAFTSQGIDDNSTSTAMTLDASGNVGVGTSSPSSYASTTLEISGSSTSSDLKMTNTTTGTGNTAGFDLELNGSDINYVNRTASGVQKFWTNATERMRIDSAGRVTKPYQPCFNVGLSNNFTPSGTFQVLPFNDASSDGKHNIGGHYATSGGNHGKFIAPVAGRYFFHALVLYQDVPNGTDMNDSFYIRKNGNTVAFSHRRAYGSNGTTMSQNYFADHSSTIINLGAGDYVQIVLKYTRTVHGNRFYSYFSGNLIG